MLLLSGCLKEIEYEQLDEIIKNEEVTSIRAINNKDIKIAVEHYDKYRINDLTHFQRDELGYHILPKREFHLLTFLVTSGGLVVFIPLSLLWLYFLIDVLRHEYTGYNKIVWLVMLIFLPFICLITYPFLRNKTLIIPSKLQQL